MTDSQIEPEVVSAPIRTQFGAFELFCFSWSAHEEDNILALVNGSQKPGDLVRIQSACYTGEIFASTDCDCHEQLTASLNQISQEGGVFVYMLCDGRGAGLLTKVRALRLGSDKLLDTAEAYDALGVDRDPRTYDRPTYVLKHLGFEKVRLLTNNPRKIDGLRTSGLSVKRAPLEIPSTPDSEPYLRTKVEKLGHLLNQFRNV